MRDGLVVREQFKVDLRGILDILGQHLYSSGRVYLRELLQNAHDAIRARRDLDDAVAGMIEIEPAIGYEKMVVRDNGIGLTAEDMRNLLSMIGGTSKKDDFAAARRHFLGQFGIGLLSCFLVADAIEVVSRSAGSPDAPTVRWFGLSDGTFTIGEAPRPLDSPGTEVRFKPRHGARQWCSTDACIRIAGDYAEFLDVPVRIGPTIVSQRVPPWKLSTEDQLVWCRERFGFDAMGIIPFDAATADVVGLAFVLPYTARPGYRTGDRIYSKGMLVADTDDLVVPQWAFFCRAVVDAGALPLTASREGLQETAALQFVRTRIGFRLLTELIIVQGAHPDVYRDVIQVHASGLKALAIKEPEVRDLLRSSLPYETTLGERTVQDLLDHPGPVPFVKNADAYHAVSEVAARAGALVVNASGLHEADLLRIVDDGERGHFREIGPRDVVGMARPTSPVEAVPAAALVAKADRALRGEGLSVRVACFEPSDQPVLWWPATGDAPSGPADLPIAVDPEDTSPVLVLNATNGAVKRLLAAPPEADVSGALRALFVTGLLGCRSRLDRAQVALFTTAVQDLVETSLDRDYQ